MAVPLLGRLLGPLRVAVLLGVLLPGSAAAATWPSSPTSPAPSAVRAAETVTLTPPYAGSGVDPDVTGCQQVSSSGVRVCLPFAAAEPAVGTVVAGVHDAGRYPRCPELLADCPSNGRGTPAARAWIEADLPRSGPVSVQVDVVEVSYGGYDYRLWLVVEQNNKILARVGVSPTYLFSPVLRPLVVRAKGASAGRLRVALVADRSEPNPSHVRGTVRVRSVMVG